MAMPEASLPPLYVVTVNYRSRGHLRSLLASLAPAPAVRACLVVNHSPEEALNDLRAPFPVTVIPQANRGYGAGLNRGLSAIGDPEAVALLANPDVVLLTPRRLSDALAYLAANPRVGCLIPRTVDAEGAVLPSCRSFYTLRSLLTARLPSRPRLWSPPGRQTTASPREGNGLPEVDWGAGAALLYRVSALSPEPAFDERFFLYFEDVDLCARLWQRGLTVVHDPRLVFRHAVQRQSRRSPRFFCYHLASLLKFITKYRGLPGREDLRRRSR